MLVTNILLYSFFVLSCHICLEGRFNYLAQFFFCVIVFLYVDLIIFACLRFLLDPWRLFLYISFSMVLNFTVNSKSYACQNIAVCVQFSSADKNGAKLG